VGNPHQLALTGAGGDLSYADTWALSNRIARAVLADGVKPGTKFAVLSPNSSLVLLAMLGAARAGAARGEHQSAGGGRCQCGYPAARPL
jgi:acyl-CoA synthetase (AMP-forming)/AMP-acid ligase II